MRFLERDSTDSTMADARRAIARTPLAELSVFSARTQTGGQGRFGRAWASPKGGLWATYVMPVEREQLPAMLDGLGLRVGVAVLETLQRTCRTLAAEMGGSDSGPSGASPKLTLKWPNDVLLNGKKVAGVLIEVVREREKPHLLIGVGVNANFPASELPGELRGRATTILAELGAPVGLASLRDEMARAAFSAAARSGLPASTLDKARAALAGVNEPVRIVTATGSPLEGTLLGLSDRGSPLVMTDRGEVEAPAGSELAHLGGA